MAMAAKCAATSMLPATLLLIYAIAVLMRCLFDIRYCRLLLPRHADAVTQLPCRYFAADALSSSRHYAADDTLCLPLR